MQTVLEAVSILLDLLAVQGAAFVISAHLEALLADVGKDRADLLSLVEHGRLVGVEPSVPRLRVVKVLGSARIRIAQVVRDIVLASQCRVVAALDGDGLRAWVAVHLHVEHKGDLSGNLRGLAQEHVWADRVGAALDAEALARLHLPEEADLPVLLGEHPDAEQVAAGHEGLVEVVAGPPGALGARVLGDGGVDGALVSELVDPEVHAAGLHVIRVRHDLVGLGLAEHA
mmetsp:Transcript_16217/g.44065  ORF Transcript_16217/g.44065 Transcript_16217/m.44065 type:complete len:229 (+) Transcript_16217:538-1224(+)